VPKWGLDAHGLRPWGLEPRLLKPSKSITDPIHKVIYINELERLIIDSPPFQRLRRLKQLGTAHLVYPGATHTRFAHALGALRVAQDLLDNVIDNPVSQKAGDDLFTQWRTEAEEGSAKKGAEKLDMSQYNQKLLEVQVLARLGALLHDLCHVPFGHTIEDDFRLLPSHDRNAERFAYYWSLMAPEVVDAIGDGPLKQELERLIVSKAEGAEDDEGINATYPFVHDLVGNTICADLIDYLNRDFYYTGLPAALGTRFMSYFFVTRSDHPHFPSRMALRLAKSDRGDSRADVISEVLKYLRHRYELSERVIEHHARLAADSMVGTAFARWIDSSGEKAVESELRVHGEESIVDRMANDAEPSVKDFGQRLRDRKLFKPITLSGPDTLALAEKLFTTWGPVTRKSRSGKKKPTLRELGRDAARQAGLSNDWDVIVVIPKPSMRLKEAEVLVKSQVAVTKLVDILPSERKQEIEESHKKLWTVRAFVNPESTDIQRVFVGLYVSRRLGIEWRGSPAQPVDERRAAIHYFVVSKNREQDEQQLLEMSAKQKVGTLTLPEWLEWCEGALKEAQIRK
jgi:HD superfamily phosphohydrolase